MGPGFRDYHHNDHDRRQRDDYRVQLRAARLCLRKPAVLGIIASAKRVTYVTRSGKVLDEDVVKTRVKVGVPVRVHYTGTGDAMMVDRVILDED